VYFGEIARVIFAPYRSASETVCLWSDDGSVFYFYLALVVFSRVVKFICRVVCCCVLLCFLVVLSIIFFLLLFFPIRDGVLQMTWNEQELKRNGQNRVRIQSSSHPILQISNRKGSS
jgi:hypothetical protein